MLQIYGTPLCKDCRDCLEVFDANQIPYTFLDITKDLPAMKTFLAIRDREALFDSVRQAGKIGIPCIIDEQGCVTLDWEMYVRSSDA